MCVCMCVAGGGGGGATTFFDFMLAFLHHKPTASMSTPKGSKSFPFGVNLLSVGSPKQF